MRRKKLAKPADRKSKHGASTPAQKDSTRPPLSTEKPAAYHVPQVPVWVPPASLTVDPKLPRRRAWEHPVVLAAGLDWLHAQHAGTREERVTAVCEAPWRARRYARACSLAWRQVGLGEERYGEGCHVPWWILAHAKCKR